MKFERFSEPLDTLNLHNQLNKLVAKLNSAFAELSAAGIGGASTGSNVRESANASGAPTSHIPAPAPTPAPTATSPPVSSPLLIPSMDNIPDGMTYGKAALAYIGLDGAVTSVAGMNANAPSANISVPANTATQIAQAAFTLPNDGNYYLIVAYGTVVFASTNSSGGLYISWITDGTINKAGARAYPLQTGVVDATAVGLFGPYQGTGQTITLTQYFTGNYGATVYTSAQVNAGTAAPTLYTGFNAFMLPSMETFVSGNSGGSASSNVHW